MKKCPYCLAEVHEAAIVCPNCNSNLLITVPIVVVEEQDAMEEAKKRNSLIARIIFSLVMAFFIALAIGSFLLLWNSY